MKNDLNKVILKIIQLIKENIAAQKAFHQMSFISTTSFHTSVKKYSSGDNDTL